MTVPITAAAALNQLHKDNATRAYIGCSLALLSTIVFRESQPYREPFTNFLAVIAQYSILLAFMAALLIETGTSSSFGLSDFTLG